MTEKSGLAGVREAAGLKDGDLVARADHESAVAAARAEATRSAQAAESTAKSAGVSAERARIRAIVDAPEAKGREALAQSLAFDTELAPEAALKARTAGLSAAVNRQLAKIGKVARH
jgi:hypothetical protein